MSEHIVVNDKKYLPSGELAKAFGYTIDYISKLAREEKVDATRIGRQWFVTTESVQSFISEADRKKEEQREQLRQTRRQEFMANQKPGDFVQKKSTAPIKANTTSSVPSSYQSSENSTASIAAVVAGTAMVIFAGLLFSVVVTPDRFAYLISSQRFVQDRQEAGAVGSYFIDAEPAVVEQTPEVVPELSQPQPGVVLLDGEATDVEVREVQAMFSDEVDVEFTDKRSGVITPVFRDTTDESYRFIMVPVQDSS